DFPQTVVVDGQEHVDGVRELDQERLLLPLQSTDDPVPVGRTQDHARGEVGPHQRTGNESTSEFLEHECRFGHAETGAAFVLRQPQGEHAGLGQLPPERSVDTADVGELAHPIHREEALEHLANAILKGDLVIVEREVHQRGSPRIRSPMMLRWICELPAAMVSASTRRRSSTKWPEWSYTSSRESDARSSTRMARSPMRWMSSL